MWALTLQVSKNIIYGSILLTHYVFINQCFYTCKEESTNHPLSIYGTSFKCQVANVTFTIETVQICKQHTTGNLTISWDWQFLNDKMCRKWKSVFYWDVREMEEYHWLNWPISYRYLWPEFSRKSDSASVIWQWNEEANVGG